MADVNWKEAPTEVREVYESLERGQPGCGPMLLSRPPEVMRSFLTFYGTVGRTLSRRVYEFVYLRVSIVNRCEPCVKVHTAAARHASITHEQIAQVERGEYAAFDPAERAALRFADKATRHPNDLGASDVEELTPHFSREQVIDLDVLVGVANLTSRLNDPLSAEI